MHAPRGFTLIELLVVIAIIGVLSSVVLASLNTARGKARDAERFSSLQQVRVSLELYASAHDGQYPNSGGNWNTSCTYPNWTVTSEANAVPGLAPDYMPSLPIDPERTNPTTCCYLYYSGGGTSDYKYMLYNCPSSYACYQNTSASKPFADPARTSSCAIYTAGASTW